MENETIDILLIEDNPDDAELLRRKLTKSANGQFRVTPVTSLKHGLEQISHSSPDLILSDLGLPDSHGLDTVTKVLQIAPNIPLVVLSGFDDEAVAIKAVQLGAQDYLVKGQMEVSHVERALFYAIERSRLQRELEQYTQEITKIQANLHKILDKNADAIIVVSKDKQIHFINPAAESLFRCKKKELLNKPFGFPLKGGKTSEIEISHEDGEKTIAGMRVVEIDWEGEPAYLASLRDVTELKRAIEALRESEEKFSKAFRSSPDMIVITTIEEGRFIEVNDSFTSTTGYTREEVIGRTSDSFNIWVKAEDRAKMVQILKEQGRVSQEEFEFRTKSGKICLWLFSADQINIGNESCIISMAIDITERKKAEEEIKRAAQEWRTTFDSINDWVSIHDRNFKFVRVNRSLADAFKKEPSEIIGKTCYQLLHGSGTPIPDCPHVKALKSKKPAKGEVRINKANIYAEISVSPIFDDDGEAIGTVHITKDITERRQAEEALRFSDAAFKSIHESVIAMDTEYTITHWNEISEQIYGIKAPEAIGKNLLDVIEIVETYPGENDERFNTLETNGYHQEEQLHRTKYGEVWVDVSIQAIESNSKRYGWVSLGTAITQRKLAEEALKRSEEKYRELISTSIDGIVSIDAQMRVIIWNQGAERIYGYTEKEMLGQSIMKIIPERDRENTKKLLTRLSKANPSNAARKVMEGVGLRKDGTEVPIELSLSSRKTEETYIITAITRDITERKEAEEKLREIDQMKSEFLSNVSHELRTPLQSISGFTKLILDGKVPDPETQHEFLQIVDRESEQLGVLINSLLDMSRLESGRFQINKRLLPIRDTIVDSIKIFHSLAHDKDVELNEDIPPVLPEMEIDGERLRQVVVNLLSNAIKYSDPGGSVTAKAENRNGELLFQVSDKGIGMDEEAMLHLFERFYRAEDKLARGGTGLGLYICKQIIEAHGGRIWAESKVGEGSTFSFTLPLNDKGGDVHG